MKIGILEICEPNHYTAVEALARTYATDPANEVVVFATPSIAALLAPLGRLVAVRLVVQRPDETAAEFLKRISATPLDRIHINTVSGHYRAFAWAAWPGKVYFSVHNLEQWFDNGLSNRIGLLAHQISGLLRIGRIGKIYQTAVLFAKECLRQPQRRRLVRNLLSGGCTFVVYSEAHAAYLHDLVPDARIVVFPFALHDHLPDRSSENPVLRICIPGTVSSIRRDYCSVFGLLEKNAGTWKNRIVLDLLGHIPADEQTVRQQIDSLRRMGFDILAYDAFIDAARYDDLLSQADVLLGNIRVQLNPYQRYGATKETGVTFNMIKSGKPALLPHDYPVDGPLRQSVVSFTDYADLQHLLGQFLDDPQWLVRLKEEAKNAALGFTAENLLARLK